MQTAIQNSREFSIVREIEIETGDAASCFQIREKLDLLFDGEARLEDAHREIKRLLFGHLESCRKCCRSFDVRARFRSGRGRGIF